MDKLIEGSEYEKYDGGYVIEWINEGSRVLLESGHYTFLVLF